MQHLINELRDLLERSSIRRGQFTLASGATSNYYCDTKATTMSPRGSRLTGEILFELLKDQRIEAVGGLALGATIISTAVSLVSDQRGQPMYGFTVRAEKKDHGLEKKVEQSFHPDGTPLLSPGRRVALVEDVVTQGGSVLKAIAAVEERGCEIVKIVALVDRKAGGGDALRARGLDYVHLFQTDTDGNLHVNERLLARAASAAGATPRPR
jgi:orotate phosphoribosyltransferase